MKKFIKWFKAKKYLKYKYQIAAIVIGGTIVGATSWYASSLLGDFPSSSSQETTPKVEAEKTEKDSKTKSDNKTETKAKSNSQSGSGTSSGNTQQSSTSSGSKKSNNGSSSDDG